MRLWSLGLLVVLGAAAPAQAPVENVQHIIAEAQVAPASVQDVEQRCDAAAAMAGRLASSLANGTRPATIASVFRPYDDLFALLSEVAAEQYLVAQTNPNPGIRAAAERCNGRISNITSDLQLSRPIYDRLAGIPRARLDANTRHVLEHDLLEFRLAGVDRDPATRARITALQKEITATGLIFSGNVRDARGVSLLEPADLAGMPADFMAAHKPEADGKIRITTDYPDVFPVLAFADKESTRHAVYLKLAQRAAPANEPVLRKLFRERAELARLLGRPDAASVALADKMVSSPKAAWAFIDEANAAATPGARHAAEIELAQWRKIEPGAKHVERWNGDYVDRLLAKDRYDVDQDQVRRYFTYDRVRSGVFQLAHDLFGADIRPWRTPVWAPGVTAWELYDGQHLVGRFYLDPFPREGKYGHASDFPIRIGVAGRSIPLGALVTNFPASGPMDHEDVVTFIHEFGHLMHSLYSGGQPWAGDDMGNLETDFIEAPSQFLEEWAWDYPTLAKFAVDEQGRPIPATLVAKMNRARKFSEALDAKTQIYQSAVALDYYLQPPDTMDFDEVWRRNQERYGIRPYVKGSHAWASFEHLNNYVASYYTYVWSKAIAVDLFTRFQRSGTNDRATAMAYRRAVLEPGSSRPAAELVRDFLGRPMSLDAYKARLAEGF